MAPSQPGQLTGDTVTLMINRPFWQGPVQVAGTPHLNHGAIFTLIAKNSTVSTPAQPPLGDAVL
jgi:hypothetical protein